MGSFGLAWKFSFPAGYSAQARERGCVPSLTLQFYPIVHLRQIFYIALA